jgi:hypothetical protein
MENLLKKAGLDVFGNTNPHAESSVYHPTVEVMPLEDPPKPKGVFQQDPTVITIASEEVPKQTGEVIEAHPVTRLTKSMKGIVESGVERERLVLDRVADFWDRIGYNPLEGKWKPKAIKASTDEVIDVVAREIPKKADRATQLAHFVSAFMASSVDIGKENTPELIKKLQKTVPKKVTRFKMFKGFKIFKP